MLVLMSEEEKRVALWQKYIEKGRDEEWKQEQEVWSGARERRNHCKDSRRGLTIKATAFWITIQRTIDGDSSQGEKKTGWTERKDLQKYRHLWTKYA